MSSIIVEMKRAKKKKKYNRTNDPEYIKLHNNIINNNNSIWTPSIHVNYKKIKTNSCYDIKRYKSKINHNINTTLNIPELEVKPIIKCKKIIMLLNIKQKEIIQRWMTAYLLMYNITLKYIKNKVNRKRKVKRSYKIKINKIKLQIKFKIKKKKELINFYNLRKILKEPKDAIIENSKHPKYKSSQIKTHMIDEAIKLVCTNYKSARTNLKRGNIKHFRIRYWRHNKTSKILDIESSFFSKNQLLPSVLGPIKYIYNNKPYELDKVTSTCKILYEKIHNRYTLLFPIKKEVEPKLHIKKLISLDPGIKTFITGLSENEIIKIGSNMQNKIKTLLIKHDKTKKRKIKQSCNRKIKNIVDELHWKSIKYLTDHYKIILIGDMSVKSIINNKTSVLTSITKRVASSLSFYKFRQRLEYKCHESRCHYKMVNERHTSKMCSCCGNYKHNLGAAAIYECNKCYNILDRDVNGCRGIYLKCI
jgi:putative transposase